MAAGLAGGFALSAGAQTVGKIEGVSVYAYGQPPGAARRATFENFPVASNEVLETVKDGGLKVRFLDDTELVMGAESLLTVDNSVFNPDRASGKLALSFTKGAFRFVTGKVRKDDVVLTTRSATIGIRGTDWTMSINARGDTTVNLREGGALVTSTANGSQVTLGPRTSVTVPFGGGVGPAAPFPALYDGAVGDRTVDASLISGRNFAPDPSNDAQAGSQRSSSSQ